MASLVTTAFGALNRLHPVLRSLIYAAVIAVALLLIAAEPVCVLWAINQLFGTGIPLTFTTWVATFILLGTVRGRRASKESA